MDPIKNTGTVDYAMTVPGNQNQTQGYEDYSSMPMVYDPSVEEKAASAKSGIALKALGAAILGGLAVYGGYRWGKGKGEKTIEKTGDDIIQKLKDLTAARDTYKKANDEAAKIAEEKTSIFTNAKKRCQKIKEALKTEEIKKLDESIAKEKKIIPDETIKPAAEKLKEFVKKDNFAEELGKTADEIIKDGGDKIEVQKNLLNNLKETMKDDAEAIKAIDKILETLA